MRKQSLLLVILGMTLPVPLFVVACHSDGGSTKAKAEEIPSAQVATAQRGNLAHTLSLAGQFQPYQVVDVHPKVTGFMAKINVDIGDRVHKGQTLAVLEVPELNAQLRGTGFEMQQAKDELLRTQHEIKRAEAIHSALHADYQRLLEASKAQPGLVAQQELDDAQSKDLSSESQVDASKAAAAGAQEHIQVAGADNERVQALQNYTNVTAPLDGVVVWRYADTGALIQSGTNSNEQDIPIVRLSQSGLLRLRMPIPEADVQFVHLGDSMEVRVDAIGRSFTGKIVRFTRDVNFETRTMETEVDVENRDLSIAPGMYANTQMQLAHANRVATMGQLAASIAHEVNQPLAGIVMNGNASLRWLALDPPNLREAREAISRVIRDGKRAGDVIARIRAMFKKTAKVNEQFDINDTIREVLALTRNEMQKNSIALRLHLPADLPPVVGDRVQVQQVLMNLILNAIEAMNPIQNRVRMLVIKTSGNGNGEVRVELQDSGVGLDPAAAERIFDSFHSTKPGGMGMGLSISRSIVENHAGRLWATANNGCGATFQFTLSTQAPRSQAQVKS